MSKLYVTNLSPSTSVGNLQACFAACGGVVDVEMVPERGGYHSTSSAYVRMSTNAAAERAFIRLHGTILDGRSLMISHAPEEEASGRKRGGGKAEEPASKVRITQQYRERTSMTYELACDDARLTVRMFFPETPAADWRVDVRLERSEAVAEAAGASRAQALHAVAENWRALPPSSAAPELDWLAVEAALKSVRAL